MGHTPFQQMESAQLFQEDRVLTKWDRESLLGRKISEYFLIIIF